MAIIAALIEHRYSIGLIAVLSFSAISFCQSAKRGSDQRRVDQVLREIDGEESNTKTAAVAVHR
jgi:hypothetical protein